MAGLALVYSSDFTRSDGYAVSSIHRASVHLPKFEGSRGAAAQLP